ncbi:patatin-like phospholipase family protein [Streptantibioticus rubrisoli]|uniref:Patatin-like phospholipase family protein n=1 Tax=Streptantibioticus rubrisoli TaxID=1387313 RepID=A0ABT1PEE0_9ACTN|nr:patatin-like phospholipase family protein [Streptantibioticus rubrisoli]MCQ4043716.1 patatin-like phospholipase family protein [Streptantibioticus rubrisoli]
MRDSPDTAAQQADAAPNPASGREPASPARAFVLGGGGALGAHEVGMLKALLEAGLRPDLVVGTSVGAINGVVVAADPACSAVDRLADLWSKLGHAGVFTGSLLERLGTVVRSGTHLHSAAPLRALLETHLPVDRLEDLAVPFQCVASSIERAAEHWFDEGPLADAVLASCAVPGLLPPVRVGDEHYLDGGLVNSIPVGRAVALGAREIYVLQVGRIESPLSPPRLPWQVAMVAFEIARRHRFARDMADLPPDVAVYVLPSGALVGEPRGTLRQLRYRRFGETAQRIERAYAASSRYLSALPLDSGRR